MLCIVQCPLKCALYPTAAIKEGLCVGQGLTKALLGLESKAEIPPGRENGRVVQTAAIRTPCLHTQGLKGAVLSEKLGNRTSLAGHRVCKEVAKYVKTNLKNTY